MFPVKGARSCTLSRYDFIWLFGGVTIIVVANGLFSRQNISLVNDPDTYLMSGSRYFVETQNRDNIVADWHGDAMADVAYDRLIQGLPINLLVPCPESIGANYTCQKNYKADWQGRSDTGNILEERMQKLRMRCKMYYPHLWNASNSQYGYNHSVMEKHFDDFNRPKMITINQKENVAFCKMPKMGTKFISRAWKEILKAPVVNEELFAERPEEAFNMHFKYYWGNQTKLTQDERYVTYTVGRSPWTRAVSVFREKCERTDKLYQCMINFGKKCYGEKHHVEFPDFVQCVVELMEIEKTERFGHVQTTYSRCGICDYPYNYVVVLENYMAETAYIFKEAGLEDPMAVLNKVRADTIRPIEIEGKKMSYTDYWKQVPSDLIDRFRFVYRYEIMLFDYPESPFVIP